MTVAYLMAKNHWTRDEALEFVRSRRPVVCPNPAFMELLLEWERKRPHADDLLHEKLEGAGLDPRDRGLVMELFYGILRHLSELDFLIGRLRACGCVCAGQVRPRGSQLAGGEHLPSG